MEHLIQWNIIIIIGDLNVKFPFIFSEWGQNIKSCLESSVYVDGAHPLETSALWQLLRQLSLEVYIFFFNFQ